LNDKRKVPVLLSSHDFFINNSKILIRNILILQMFKAYTTCTTCLPKNVVNVSSRSMHRLLCYRTVMVFKNKIEFFQVCNAPSISLQACKPYMPQFLNYRSQPRTAIEGLDFSSLFHLQTKSLSLPYLKP
jgi:hypothetical protein